MVEDVEKAAVSAREYMEKILMPLGDPSILPDIQKSNTADLGRSGESSPTRVDVETQTEVRPPLPLQLKKHFNSQISTNHADVLLLACCLVSGLTDSTLYNAYFTFVSMQTGNTIFVGLGASAQNPRPYGWARSLVSIICFMLGSLFFSRFNRLLSARRRGTLVASFLLQSIFILVAAGVIEGDIIDGRIPSTDPNIQWNQIGPIALLSFQAAGQIVGSRALDLGEVPTVVITSLLCDLWSDPNITAPWEKNLKRNRRVIAFVLTMVGAIAGGWISKATHGVQAALWVAGGIKVVITIAWVLWTAKEEGVIPR